MNFGDQLSELRKDNRYTQKQLAETLNLSDSSISNYEKGTNEPALSTLIKMALLFEVSTDFLLGLTNVRTQYNTKRNEKIGDYGLDIFIEQVLKLDKEHRKMLSVALRLISLDNVNNNRR